MLRYLDERPRWLLTAAAAALLAVITWIDSATGYELELFAFYFVPVALAAWFLGRRLGLAFAAASAACWYLSDQLGGHVYSSAYLAYWGALMRLASFVTTAVALSSIRERTRQLEDLLHVVSHDLRNPLSVVSGQVHLLRKHGGTSPFVAARCEAMARAARSMDRMIDDLLDGGLWKAGKLRLCLEPVDLVAWLPSLLDRFGTAREVERVDLELPAGSAWVLADGLRLERVVLNLVANALKYSPEDGRVRVSISSAEGLATLTVSDVGPGIPEEDRPRLFERFHRGRGAADRPGVGLGLFSARLLVLAHGGRLRVSGAPGRGATLLVDLPAADVPGPSIHGPRDRPAPLR